MGSELAGFVSATGWNVFPGLGTDTSPALSNAFAGVPSGATLYIPPGHYVCSGALACDRAINIYAWGAVFDFTGTELPSGTAAFRYGLDAPTPEQQIAQTSVAGLAIRRNVWPGAAPFTASGEQLRHIGFEWRGLARCVVDTCEAEGFEIGHLIRGSVTQPRSNQDNGYQNLTSMYCRYGLQIERLNASGNTIGNNFWGGRHTITALPDHTITNPQVCQGMRVLYSGAGPEPTSNRFYEISIEGSYGRKVYCEGSHSVWLHCRYIGSGTGSADIEFVTTAGGVAGVGNTLFLGEGLLDNRVAYTKAGVTTTADPTAPGGNFKVATGGSVPTTLYGDGSDGDITISTPRGLDRDYYYSALTLISGATLTTSGFKIFCLGTLMINTNCSIRNDGQPGGNATASGVGAFGAGTGAGSLGLGVPGKAGSRGVAGGNGNIAEAPPSALASEGGAGGGGGFGGNTPLHTGGVTTSGTSPGRVHYRALNVNMLYAGTTPLGGGCGGNGGSSGGSDDALVSSAGGGGGGGGGVIAIFAHSIVNSGKITANGGAGGRGWPSSPCLDIGDVGGGGGGGGAGGGAIYMAYDSYSGSGSIEAKGGSAGLRGRGCGAGSVGADGGAGTSGTIVRTHRPSGVVLVSSGTA